MTTAKPGRPAIGEPINIRLPAEVGRTWAAVKSRLQKLAKQERSV